MSRAREIAEHIMLRLRPGTDWTREITRTLEAYREEILLKQTPRLPGEDQAEWYARAGI